MSAAKMVADSTQDASDGRKKKKKLRKSGKKVTLPEDEDSDLDLKKDLKPISFYDKDRHKMVEEMFHAVRGASMQRALPELLKSIPLDELKLLCLEQLEVMSKKRIKRILAGEESANISSSGTDDDSSQEENQEGKSQNEESMPDDKKQDEGPMADSTSISQEGSQKSETDSEHVQTNAEMPQQSAESYLDVEIKQEPPDSEPEPEYDPEPEEEEMEEEDEEEDEEEEEEEEEEEDPPEAYTSGSEDGELVKRDTSLKDSASVEIKQEVLSDSENQDKTQEEEFMDGVAVGGTEKDGADKQNVEEIEGELLSSVETKAAETGNSVLPSIMMDQMELLELEMRARAIKAMLTSHEEEPDDG